MKKPTITIVKGDSFEKTFKMEQSNSLIAKVYFTSKDLNLQKELSYDSTHDVYTLSLTKDETADLREVLTTYDITVQFSDDKILTVVYKDLIHILPKINKVTY